MRETGLDLPHDFIPASAASKRLEQGMWGGVKLPEAVQEIRRRRPKLFLRVGPWSEAAADRLRQAVRSGELTLYVAAQQVDPEPVQVPMSIVSQMIWGRGRVSDHLVRTPHSWVTRGLVSPDMYHRLRTGILLISKGEFEKWYRVERRRGLWRSQLHRRKPKRGRPRKRDESLRDRILGAAQRGWTALKGIPELGEELRKGGRECPSDDTLTREVDELYHETSDPRFKRRRSRKRKSQK